MHDVARTIGPIDAGLLDRRDRVKDAALGSRYQDVIARGADNELTWDGHDPVVAISLSAKALAMRAQTHELVEPVSPADHLLGPPGAPVTVVEYGDFECPKCRQAAGAVKLLVARFEQQIRFVFRHFPLEEIHPHALQAAQGAECAGGQARFWQMHDLMFENQMHLGLVRLYGYARKLELDMARFTAEMDHEVYLRRVREHQRSGECSGVRATPAFFLNGRIQDVSYGLQSLFEGVEAELRSVELRAPLAGGESESKSIPP